MALAKSFQEVVEALRCLPGVGAKSAQRLALHLLHKDKESAALLAKALQQALAEQQYCQFCRMLSDAPLCPICDNPHRHNGQICVVENPSDVLAIESTAAFHGQYFVLYGNLAPVRGIEPEDLGLPLLENHLARGIVKEVILALPPKVESEITAAFVARLCDKNQVTTSYLARGLPSGGDLEYVDNKTLAYAFSGRKSL